MPLPPIPRVSPPQARARSSSAASVGRPCGALRPAGTPALPPPFATILPWHHCENTTFSARARVLSEWPLGARRTRTLHWNASLGASRTAAENVLVRSQPHPPRRGAPCQRLTSCARDLGPQEFYLGPIGIHNSRYFLAPKNSSWGSELRGGLTWGWGECRASCTARATSTRAGRSRRRRSPAGPSRPSTGRTTPVVW